MERSGPDERELATAAKTLARGTIFSYLTCYQAITVLTKPDVGATVAQAVAFVEAYSRLVNAHGLLFCVDVLAGMAKGMDHGVPLTGKPKNPGRDHGPDGDEAQREHARAAKPKEPGHGLVRSGTADDD
jgi:hypothetical protein